MRILLLEDSSTDAELTHRGLTNSIPGCVIRIASTLKDARSILNNEEGFDVALLDMSLPDGNGQELLSEIRLAGYDMAVVMLTGSGNEEVAVAALKAGADDYVMKRQDYISNLSKTIHFAIESYKHSKQLRTDLLKVLYIEHNTADLDLTVRHLKQYSPNIVVESVVNAEEALLILPQVEVQGKYQVILMDYRLPGLNALEFIKIIRQERNYEIPIIIVSGQGNEDIAVQALKLGASEYLIKRDNYLFRLPTLVISAYQHYELKQSQKALKESEAKYRLIAENSGDVIFTLDLDMNYTYISPAIKKLRDYSPEEAILQKINEVLTPESYDLAIKLISETLYLYRKTQEDSLLQRTVELEMYRKDGTTVWTEVQASLILDNEKQPVGIMGATRDISKRKFALGELRKLSRAVEQSPDSILITNTRGDIEYVNPALLKITGYSTDELIGQNPRIFKSGNKTKSEYESLWHTITNGMIWEGEFQNKKKNGELFWEATNISPVIDNSGKITHFLAIRRDITEQKRMTQELITAKEHAEESDKLKSAFLANMSHEIRTPLNGILGFTELLVDPECDPDQKEGMGKIILENGELLLTIINDVLDISKIEAGQIVLHHSLFDVHKLMDEIKNSFTLKAQNIGLDLRFVPCPNLSKTQLNSDFMRLKQVFTNLVSNAIKYTEKGYIEIGCFEKPSELIFYVKDSGIGISEDAKERIFERFNRHDAFTKKVGGTGLGLAIAKSFVEILGGKIWLETEIGKGSTFYFSLPSIGRDAIHHVSN